jgi:glycosyltransferase involved in cell wall biosynthesis
MARFSVIIPTIWKTDNIYDIVDNLFMCSEVAEVIVIDNDPRERERRLHPSAKVITKKTNSYVNAAWNEGVKISKMARVCLLNDDIYADVETLNTIFEKYTQDDSLVGVHQSCYYNGKSDNIRFEDHSSVTFGFGCMMLFHIDVYNPIPETLKIAYGDNWLHDHAPKVLAIHGAKLETRPQMSTSVLSSPEILNISNNDRLEWIKLHKGNCDKTICLNMIVKDESHIIESTLNNILENIKIDYWVISDTGSTDGTQDIIMKFFDKHNIAGELYQDEWKDFAHNRNLALEYAKDKCDYTFIFDADDVFVGDFLIPEKLTHDQYCFLFGPDISYYRPLLIKSSLNWKWHGVLHEFLGCDYQPTNSDIFGNYYVISGRTGNRSLQPNKYLNDAKILEAAFYEEERVNGDLLARYAFYCAQSYKDAGKPEDALKWYVKRTELGSWIEEVYYSYLMAGDLAHELGNDELAVSYYLEGQECHNGRAECYYRLANMYREKSKHRLSYTFAKLGKEIPMPTNALFSFDNVYSYLLDFEISISAWYVGKMEEGKNACIHVMNSGNHSESQQSIENLKFYV